MTKYSGAQYSHHDWQQFQAGGDLELAPNHFRLVNSLIRESRDPAVAATATMFWENLKYLLKSIGLKIVGLDLAKYEGGYSWTVSLARRGGKDHRGLRIRVLVGECAALPALAPETFADWLVPLLGTIPMQQVFEYALEA